MIKLVTGRLAAPLILTVSILAPAVAFATGIPVVDVANLTQNTLTAIRELQSDLNEATMIANQSKQLANDALNLTSLNYSIVGQFNSEFRQMFSAVGSVQGLMQNLGDLESRFQQLYPDFNDESSEVPTATIAQQINTWVDQSREMMKGAEETGGQVLANLPTTQGQLDQLMSSSQGAAGILEAAQSGNQIAATISQNLMNLTAVLSTYAQAHMAYLEKQNSGEAAAINRLNQQLNSLQPSNQMDVPLDPY